MAKRGGYIKLYRALATSPLWTKEPFTRGQAWADLLLLANYAPGHLRVRGNRIEIARGQVGWSAERLAKRWTWSRKKVARFLNELEKDQQIAQHKSFVSSLFTITNYERYQRKVSAERPAQAQQKPSSGTAEGTADDPLYKKKPKKKERNSSASEFVAPTLEQVTAYCQTRKNGIDPEEFIAHYEANGWVQGKNKPIRSWKAAMITWEKRRRAANPPQESRVATIDDLTGWNAVTGLAK